MNYTNPNRKSDDKPEDWLRSALMFSQALGAIIPESKGVVVELKGDILEMDPSTTKILIHNNNEMIIVDDISDNDELKNGDWVITVPHEEE